jgi:RNA polymerase sigma-70 factor (ECF subfamily)
MLRDHPAAEDMVHDAFERVLVALGRYPEERIQAMTLRPWLYRITLNVVRNHLKRTREVPIKEAPVAPASDGPDDSRETVFDVLATLKLLPERQRMAVTLRYLQDLPYAEISAATGWPEGTARTLVRRDLARLRDLLHVEDPKDGDG